MSDDPVLPREGFTTLGAAFTREALEKVRRVVLVLSSQGRTEAQVLQLMKKDLPDFGEAGRKRLYDLATGARIPDDFSKDDVASQKAVKKDTLEIELKSPPADLASGALVRWLGTDWVVARLEGPKLLLRKLA